MKQREQTRTERIGRAHKGPKILSLSDAAPRS
jgi:hypothetical protein